MTAERLQLAATLADVLAQENAALQHMDLTGAVALLPAQQAALAALTADPAAAAPSADAAALGQRLKDLVADNRVLLERAITVQTRIVGIIARAARPAAPRAYGATGQHGPAPRTAALALRTTA